MSAATTPSLQFAAPPLLCALRNGCWWQEGSIQALLHCGLWWALHSWWQGPDPEEGHPWPWQQPPPRDCHRDLPGTGMGLKGADPLRACLLHGGASHLSDLLHTKSGTSSCPHGLHPCPVPITGVAATSCLSVAVGAGCSSGKGSACLKSPFIAERCPQPRGRCHLLLAHLQDPRALPALALGSCTRLARRSPWFICLPLCFLKTFVIYPSPSPWRNEDDEDEQLHSIAKVAFVCDHFFSSVQSGDTQVCPLTLILS